MSPSPRRIPFGQWLTLRRRDKLIAVLFVTLLAVLTTTAAAWRSHRASTQRHRFTGSVTAVIDAATLDITLASSPAQPRRIRLLGAHGPAAWQPAAADWLNENLLGQTVTVTFDHSGDSGDAGFVYRSDGLFVNEFMIDQGILQADKSADHALASWFARRHDWAARTRRGQWNTE